MGLPLDTTAAQPKLRLYRYVSLSLSPSLSAILFLLSPSGRTTFSFPLDLTVSLALCIFTFPFLFLFPSTSLVFLAVSLFLVRTRRYSKRPTAFARYLPPKSTLRYLRLSSRAHPAPSLGIPRGDPSTDCAL